MADKIKVPNLYGAIVMVFPTNVSTSSVESQFNKRITIDRYDDCIEVTYLENVSNSWDVDDLLTALFEQCDIEYITSIVQKLGGYILVDISFHSMEGATPALLFYGKNMEIIRRLNACISIDIV